MNLASYIDHTILKPETTFQEVKRICQEAIDHNFAAVCIPPYYTKKVSEILEDKSVKLATVVGFPFAFAGTPSKVDEIKRALEAGADEIDAVVHLNALKNGDWNYVRNDIDSVARAVHMRGKTIKIIFETGLLTEDEILRLCDICNKVEVDYVKTSTGYIAGGATAEMVAFMKANVSSNIKVKASGGIRSKEAALSMVEAGASRLGTSSGLKLV